MKRLIRFCVLLALINLAAGQVDKDDHAACDESIVKQVTKQCRNASRLKTLDEFYGFYENLDHLTNKCLRPQAANPSGPGRASQLAEEECNQQALPFYQVRPLAKLVARWRSAGKLCTLEFAMRVYHLHRLLNNHVAGDKLPGVLARILRLLANSAAAKCRLTLAGRLHEVERRAPDSQQHVRLIVGLINLGSGDKLVSRLKPFEAPVLFVPTLEREAPGELNSMGLASSLAKDGYELRAANSLRLSHDSARMSCKALKLYHVNLLGSLGLLASLGYGAPPALVQGWGQLVKEKRPDQEIQQRWLLSALLCQALRGVLKMRSETAEGKLLHRFKIMATQEFDVGLPDELDTTFGAFKLSETLAGADGGAPLNWADHTEALASHWETSKLVRRALEHRAQLLAGPSFKLAGALGTYLDLSAKTGRLEAIEAAIGVELQFEEMVAGEDEDAEEEDEE